MKSIYFLIAGTVLCLIGIGFGLLCWNFVALVLFTVPGVLLNIIATIILIVEHEKWKKLNGIK